MSNSLWPHGLYGPWNSPGQNTGVGSLSLLQGIFPTQGLNPGIQHYRWILSQLSHKGSPRILEWVAYSFSRGSSWPRNRTGVSCIAGGFFTNWATREAQGTSPSYCREVSTHRLPSYSHIYNWGQSRNLLLRLTLNSALPSSSRESSNFWPVLGTLLYGIYLHTMPSWCPALPVFARKPNWFMLLCDVVC